MAFVFGNFFSYNLIPYLLAIFPILFLLLFTFCLPETPSQLLRMGRKEDAVKALMFFRGETKANSELIKKEIETLEKANVNSSLKKDDQGVSFADFSKYFI